MNRNRLLRLLVSLVFVAAFILVGRRFLDARFTAAFARLRTLNPLWLVAVAGTYLFTRFLDAEVMRMMLARLGHPISRREAFTVTMVKMYTNLVISKAGVGTAAAYLKLRHGVRLTDFGSVMFAVTVLQIIGIGVVGLGSQAYLRLAVAVPWHVPIGLVFALLMIGGVLSLFLRLPVPRHRHGRLAERVRRLNESWVLISQERGTVSTLLALQGAILALRAIRLFGVFYALGYTATNPVAVLVASLLGDLGLMISLTPMGLGFREAAVGYGAGLIGVAAPVAVAVTLVDRIIWSVGAAIVAQFFIWFAVQPAPLAAAEQPGNPRD